MEKVFWSQYAEAGHPVPLSDQLKQLVELHKVAEQAMKGLIVRLWPTEAMPGSYFGLVRRLVDACPWIEVIKHSACIEGACRALARAKVHWGQAERGEACDGRSAAGQGVSQARDVLSGRPEGCPPYSG